MDGSGIISILVGVIAALQGILIGLVLRLSGRLTRLETRWDESDRRAPERKEGRQHQQREIAEGVCRGLHECYYRPGGGGGTNPRLRVYAPDHDTIDEAR